MTTATFRYIDPSTYTPQVKPWSKVDGPGTSFDLTSTTRPVHNLRDPATADPISPITTDTAGFSVHHHPLSSSSSSSTITTTSTFLSDHDVRTNYYPEVERALRAHLPAGDRISKIVIFDHTIRRRDRTSPRQPIQQVHVDQTPAAAEARVRRHLAPEEAETVLSSSSSSSSSSSRRDTTDTRKGKETSRRRRYQIVNVWRPIEHPATDFPLAVIDVRTTSPRDFVKVDLLYPVPPPSRPPRQHPDDDDDDGANHADPSPDTSPDPSDADENDDDDDRGKEVLPDPSSYTSTAGYQVKGETFAVAPNDRHRFYYVKDMTPDEVMFIKCVDSDAMVPDDGGEDWQQQTEQDQDQERERERERERHGEAEPKQTTGKSWLAPCTPHTAFVDPQTPATAPGRQSIEVRCLVLY